MSQPLIGPVQLIKDTWSTFVKTWDATVRISAWFLVVGVISVLAVFIPQSAPGYLAIFLADLAGVLISLWASIRLYRAVFAIERNESPLSPEESSRQAIGLILPLIIVQLIAGLAVVGGFILLILPGIYIGIRLTFSQLAVMDPRLGKKTTDALKDSWDLTKGRFWPILGRVILGSLCFGILIIAIVAASTLLVGAVAGGNTFLSSMTADSPPPAVTAALSMIQSIAQAALVPLAPIFQIKLYHSLRTAQ
jgi:hypothetical protein